MDNSSSSLRTLLVEHDPAISRGLTLRLESLGHQVIAVAKDGQQAIRLSETMNPDLVVLDVDGPGLDGLQISWAILETRPVPIIVLSKWEEADLPREARNIGALAYVAKSAVANTLASAIDLALGRFDELQTLRREAGDPREALELHRVVERAKSILMKRLGLSEAEAFRRLRQESGNQNEPLKCVAEAVLLADKLL